MLSNAYAWIGKLETYDYEEITIDNTLGGVGLTSTKLTTTAKPKECFITVETAPIRYRMDGGAPTSAVGHQLFPTDSIRIDGLKNMENFRAIRISASGKIFVSYKR